MVRSGRAPGAAARSRVVAEAAALATVIGIGGLSIGELAKRLGMPKSSLYVLFGSKEELQLATVDAARKSFIAEVVVPAMDTGEEGHERLGRLAECYIDYVRRRVFPGGCFFVQVAAEVGGHTGPVHDKIAEDQREWSTLLREQARIGVERGELAGDPDQLAFEVGSILTGANVLTVLHDDDSFCDRALAAVRARLYAARSTRTARSSRTRS